MDHLRKPLDITYVGGAVPKYLCEAFTFLNPHDNHYLVTQDFTEAHSQHADITVISSDWLVQNIEVTNSPTYCAGTTLLDMQNEEAIGLLLLDCIFDAVSNKKSTLIVVTRLRNALRYGPSCRWCLVPYLSSGVSEDEVGAALDIGLIGKEADVYALLAGASAPKLSSEILEQVWGEDGDSTKVKYVMKRIRQRLASLGADTQLVNQRGAGWRLKQAEDAPEGEPVPTLY